MELKKILTLGVILLFIGVAVAPSINSTVVKASNDNNLVEVTSQTCGIKGFGNTTVKLTKQQYQNLEQYLVEFRARLNQTTTREEAVPIFKEAVVELNKYGLLPKGMSVEKAQKLVLGVYQQPRLLRLLDKIQQRFSGTNYSDYENYNCLISGQTTNTVSIGPILGLTEYITDYMLWYFAFHHGWLDLIYAFFLNLALFLPLVNVIDNLNPVLLLSMIGLGEVLANPGYQWYYYPANGWIYTNGLNGVKNWSGDIFGDLNLASSYEFDIPWIIFLWAYYPGILGFTGIKIGIALSNSFYLGYAFKVKIATG